ncbi:MAG: cytochrome c biogenesis protein ResB, partial [Mariniphaga sp.]|nr:cytochrome c biogenesis protein ResB [Mariniphaga sp.]
MKKIITFISSMFFTGLLLVIFAIAIAWATFVENDYGTLTAKILIYNSWWFEVLLLVIIVNLTGSIFVNKLISKKKWTMFLFHVAFAVIIIGAALTRYYGFEGSMHIREGGASNSIISESTFINTTVSAEGQSVASEKEIKFSGYTANRYSEKIEVAGKSVKIENLQFMPSALETIVKDVYGEPLVALMAFSNNGQRIDFSLNNKKIKVIAGVSLGFENTGFNPDINISENNGEIFMIASDSVTITDMVSNESETFAPGLPIHLTGRSIFGVSGISLIFKQYYPNGRIQLSFMPQDEENFHYDAFLARITVGNESSDIVVSGLKGLVGEPQ